MTGAVAQLSPRFLGMRAKSVSEGVSIVSVLHQGHRVATAASGTNKLPGTVELAVHCRSYSVF